MVVILGSWGLGAGGWELGTKNRSRKGTNNFGGCSDVKFYLYYLIILQVNHYQTNNKNFKGNNTKNKLTMPKMRTAQVIKYDLHA